jgi:3-oxoacyl-[acyl-carrier-protein] synthase II
MDKNRRTHKATKVVVTGVGMVTPLGIGKEEFGRRLFAGECAIDIIKTFDTSSFKSHLGAEVTDFVPRDFISVKNLRRMDRISSMSTAAARLALDDAGIKINEKNRDRVGIILGTSFGATDVTVQFAGTLLTEGPAFVNPILVPNTVMNAPAGHASIELGFRGVNTTVTHFAVSAETALAYAVEEIRRGTADFGSKEACRPFDEARNGIVAGEGCGMVCLESWESAVTRGRQPYCEIKGFGLGSSPTSPTAWPDNSEGIKRTISRALENAGVAARDIQAIYAAANGGKVLDAVEAEAYAEVFSGLKKQPLITSLKGALGESFSGGGIRACALALSMEKNAIPPTVGLIKPVKPLGFVAGDKREMRINNAALAGISFGGTYVYLVFANCDK